MSFMDLKGIYSGLNNNSITLMFFIKIYVTRQLILILFDRVK